MRYVLARIKQNNRDEAYRIYVTKSLQLAPQNKCITKDYTEFANPQKVETRSGGQIVLDVIKKAGLKFGPS